MAYSDEDIKKRFLKRFCITPFLPESSQLTPVGYDLTIGALIILPLQSAIEEDPATKPVMVSRLKAGSEDTELTIPPRAGVIIATYERIYSSGRSLATVHGRSKMTARGLVVNSVTIDPNFDGNIVIFMSNTTDVPQKIHSHDRILTLIFHGVETETKKDPLTDFHGLIHFYGDLYGSNVAGYLIDYYNGWNESELFGEHEIQKQKVKDFRKKGKYHRKLIRISSDYRKIWKDKNRLSLLVMISDIFIVGTLSYILGHGISPEKIPDFDMLPDPKSSTTELMFYLGIFQVLMFYIFGRIKHK